MGSEHEHNKELSVTHSSGGPPFSIFKKVYDLTHIPLMGLDRNQIFYGLDTMATNTRKATKYLTLLGIRETLPKGMR